MFHVLSSTVRSYYRIFFFNDTATTEIYTLSLHDALPICGRAGAAGGDRPRGRLRRARRLGRAAGRRSPLRHPDRKSTRLNSSHANISYAVFCLKKKYFSDIYIRSSVSISNLQSHPYFLLL